MTSERPILDLDGLTKRYATKTGLLANLLGKQRYVTAVDDVSLELAPGEVFGIVGESGSGKSTLVETVLRLDEPTGGRVKFEGTDLSTLSPGALRAFRENAQMIFQDPYETLNPQKTVFQSVAEPLRNFRDLDYDGRRAAVSDALSQTGLRPPESFLDSYPNQLSGGQRQRVNVARAIVLEPSLLVADEPLSMLDVSLQAGIIKLLARLRDEIGFSMLYVSHNLPVVSLVADRIGVMYRGRLVEVGDTEAVLDRPAHPYTRALVAALPDLSRERERVLLPSDGDEEGTEGCQFYPRCPEAMPECATRVPALAEADGREVACFLHHDRAE